ncbi:zinc finger protein 3-like [Cheilinus undulatus]|uniref:zinc finger protein 3-like n=1 Tax=Cheilinus undulatus TaxID=241271 RepID=UPI001BD532C5|nr:zinc finger protein 3-like [Cheilinus undulatus]
MSKVQMLRSLVNQRLTAAAEEIFELFERTIAEYEEELRSKEDQHQRLDAVINPGEELHRQHAQQLVVRKEEVLPQQQKWCSSLNQEQPPEPADIKEERVEQWTHDDREQLKGEEKADINMFTFTPVPVKSEEEDGEKCQSSQFHQVKTDRTEREHDGEDCGRPKAAVHFRPVSYLQHATQSKTLQLSESETDDSAEWEECDAPQEGLYPLKDNDIAVSDVKCNTGDTSVSSSECAPSFGGKNSLKNGGIHSKKPFGCSECEKSFIKKSDMVKHMIVHTGEKLFSCLVCGKSFTQRGHYKRHSVVHTGEKPFSCSTCGKRFSLVENLKKHSNIHTGVRPFSCSVCGKRFSQNGVQTLFVPE